MKTLNEMGMQRASHIETGFGGWRADGFTIQTYDEWKTTESS